MTIESLLKRKKPRRKIEGIAAALLPYREDGKIAVDEFQKHLVATQAAGLQNAVNMDTSYVNYLSNAEKADVLLWTREALGPDTPFVAGAYIEHDPGDDVVALYRRQMNEIKSSAARPSSSKRAASTENPTPKKPPSTPPPLKVTPQSLPSNSAKCSPPTAKSSTTT